MADFANGSAGEYWTGLITRAEAQKVFDEYAGILVGMQERQVKMEFLIGFLVSLSGKSEAEIQAWMDAKMEQFLAAQAPKESN